MALSYNKKNNTDGFYSNPDSFYSKSDESQELSIDELDNIAGGDGQDPMMYSVYLYVPPSREIVTRVVVKACCPAEAEKKALNRVLSCYKVHSMEPWDGNWGWS